MVTAADTAREAARRNDGRFGEQPQTAAEATLPQTRAWAGAGSRFADRDRSFGGFALGRVEPDGNDGREAALLLDGERVGVAVQDGGGGGPYVRVPNTVREHMNALAADWADHPHAILGFGEVFASELFNEHDAMARLGGERLRGRLPIMLPQHVAQAREMGGLCEYAVVTRGVGQEESVRANLARRGELDGALYFDGEAWVPFQG